MLAQEEAGLLNHSYIGTEHILLGLIQEGEGVAAKALSQLGIPLEDVQRRVEQTVGPSATAPTGSPPFTPRAKKVMELSLREALQIGHNYIGTEHLLLGLVREGEGVGAQVLSGLGADPARVRQQVIQLLSGYVGRETVSTSAEPGPWERLTARRRGARIPSISPLSSGGLVSCSFCGREPPASGRIVRGGDAFICEHCIRHWHRALYEPGARQVITSRHVFGPEPSTGDASPDTLPEDPDAAREQIVAAFTGDFVLSDDGESVLVVAGGENLGPTLARAVESNRAAWEGHDLDRTVDEVVFTSPHYATVWFTITIDGVPVLPHQRGDALVVEGQWKMARSTFCDLMRMAGVECPPALG